MNGLWAPLFEAIDRLLEALAAHANPCAVIEDCTAEMIDNLNNCAYQIENEPNGD